MKVSVIGAGNGAYAMAFHLVQMGHEVLIYCSAEYMKHLEPVRTSGVIEGLQCHEKNISDIFGVSEITKVTTDAKEAVEFSTILMLVVPAFGQKATFATVAPYLTKDHVFISLPGNFAFIDYLNVLKEQSDIDVSQDLPFTLVEASSIPYACRRIIGSNQVFIGGVKKELQIGVYPSSRAAYIKELVEPLFSLTLQLVTNVLEVGFYNLNAILHPPVTVYNAGWIEASNGGFLFYIDGASKSVFKILMALDKERIKIADAFGLQVRDITNVWKGWYGIEAEGDLHDVMKNSTVYYSLKAPSNLSTRYLTEDINFVLFPLVEYIHDTCNLQTPVTDAIITSATYLSALPIRNERNFKSCPISLDKL